MVVELSDSAVTWSRAAHVQLVPNGNKRGVFRSIGVGVGFRQFRRRANGAGWFLCVLPKAVTIIIIARVCRVVGLIEHVRLTVFPDCGNSCSSVTEYEAYFFRRREGYDSNFPHPPQTHASVHAKSKNPNEAENRSRSALRYAE